MKRIVLMICACACMAGAAWSCKSVDGGIDTSRLTEENHPRVIFTDGEFDRLAKLYAEGSNPYFNQIHDAVIQRADSALGAPEIERVFIGFRMLRVSINAQRRLLSCAYAYKTTGERKYLEQAEHDLRTVCSFEDWNHLQHGLDVGEMSVGVGLSYDWLYNDLSEDTKEMVRSALDRYAFVPFLDGSSQDKIYTKQFNNHNQVVNSGLVASALAVYEYLPEHSLEIIKKAIESNAIAQELAYSPDGNCREGYHYYAYGTLFESVLLTEMESCLGTDFGLSKVQGFAESPSFMIFMEGPSGYYFNFGDSDWLNAPCLPQWYFAWKFGDLSALYLEKDRLDQYSGLPETGPLPVIAWYASQVDVTEIPAPSEHLYFGRGETPVVIVHENWNMDETDRFLAMKGGSGDAPHAHLDLGSFVFDAEGVRWAADLGKQEYNEIEAVFPDFWHYDNGSGRWKAFRFNNFNHNTLTVNGQEQVSTGFCPITDHFYDENGRKGGTVDISAAFEGQLASAVRTVYIEGDDLVVSDSIAALEDSDADLRWTLVTFGEPTVENGGVTLRIGDKTRYLSSASDVDWTTWSAESENSWDAPNPGYYECGYTKTLKAGESATITVRLSLAVPE